MAEMALRRVSVPEMAVRYSHSIFAAALLVFMFIGFRQFYLAGNSAFTGGPLVEGLAIYAVPHGICATAWMLTLVLQPLLVANRRQTLHKTLGPWLLGLAILVLITGTLVAINAPRITPESMPFGNSYREFVLVMLSEMAVFAGLVTAAVLNRKRPHIHRSLMLLSGLAILSAATARIAFIQVLAGGLGWWGLFAPELMLGLIFIGVRWLLVGKLDRWFAGGLAGMMAIYFVAFQLATTSAWNTTLVSVFGL
jgi:hypothetical protein